jgi:hypothetical protein
MKSLLPTLVAAVVSWTFSGCAMAPLRPEVPHLGNDLAVRASTPELAKLVLINNSSKMLHGADGTGRINVRLDGKAVGGPNIGEFVQIQVPKGMHTLEIWHLDLIKFRTEREIAVDQDLVIELKATPFSNKVLVQTTMPDGNFRPHVVATEEQTKTVFHRTATTVTSYVQSMR